MAGLVTALRDEGVELADADRIIGTSAGSIVGTVLAAGGDLTRILQPRASDTPAGTADPAAFAELIGILMTPGLGAPEAWRRCGARALEMSLGDPDDHVARMARLIGTSEWPAGDLVITATDVTEGRFRALTRFDGVPLDRAVAASTCAPGVFPPIPIDGHHYMDGGLRSPVNADLAANATVIVVIEPSPICSRAPPSTTNWGAAQSFPSSPNRRTSAPTSSPRPRWSPRTRPGCGAAGTSRRA